MLLDWLDFMTVPLLEWMALAVYFRCMRHPEGSIRAMVAWSLSLPAFLMQEALMDMLPYTSRLSLGAMTLFAIEFLSLLAGMGRGFKGTLHLTTHAYMHTQTLVSFDYVIILSTVMRDVKESPSRPFIMLAIGFICSILIWSFERHTFTDTMLRNASWWIPLIAFAILAISTCIVTYTLTNALDKFFAVAAYDSEGLGDLRGALYQRVLTLLFADSLIYMAHVQYARRLLRRENMNLLSTVRDQQAQYTRSQQNLDEIHRLTHDLKHWLILFDPDGTGTGTVGGPAGDSDRAQPPIVSDAQRSALFEQLHRSIDDSSSIQNCGNVVLNAILFEKNMICARHSIRFTAMADGTLLAGIQPLDLTSLIGNLLDNAIEATMKLEDEHARTIHFSVTRRKSFVLIHGDNTCMTGRLRKDGKGNLLTTKMRDGRPHGQGIRSIRHVARKYQGVVTSSTDEHRQIFSLDIMFPANAVASSASATSPAQTEARHWHHASAKPLSISHARAEQA